VSENVKIPLALLNHTIYLLEHIDVSAYGPPISEDYDAVLSSLLKKKRSLDLRQLYANIVCAPDEESRFDARMKYLEEKRFVSDGY
jgi:hypothetical protein